MDVTLVPIKQIFYNPENDYRILSCVPSDWRCDIELNNYGNFTLSGYNLMNIPLNQTVNLNIIPDTDSKYPASYIVVGYSGIIFDEEVKVDPNHELLLLQQIMTADQAKNVNNAYPNFIELVLNNKESEIDPKNIYNVGDYRFNEYCHKIKENFNVFLFFAKTKEYNITDFSVVSKLCFSYENPEIWEQNYKAHPYDMLHVITDWGFQKIDKTILSAMPEFSNSSERAKYCIYFYLKQNEEDGDTRIDARIIRDIIAESYPELTTLVPNIIKTDMNIHYDPNNKMCGFYQTFKAELTIADNILYRINHPVKNSMEWQKFQIVNDMTMTEEQNQICRIANDESIGMMVGVAGSGKSQATKALVQMLDNYGKTYCLLAPTGIAAKRLKEVTHRNASTIHKALAQETFLNQIFDYIIIDEMSCVGVMLLSEVFNLIPLTTKIIFICDNAQLASIACGNVVEDIINSGKMPTTTLTKIFRYGTSGIATIATNTRNGKIDGRNNNYNDNDYKCVEISKAPLQQIADEYSNLLLENFDKNDILILCPYNKSSLGTYTINAEIQNKFNQNHTNEITIKTNRKEIKEICYRVGDKVINIKNNYKADKAQLMDDGTYEIIPMVGKVMNGDIGIIRSIEQIDKNNYHIYVQFDDGIIVYSPKTINCLLLGYAISCHKSQGSQAKAVISVIGKNHSNLITRNLLYVAVTRAQNKLVEIVDKDSISVGLNKVENVERTTWLQDLLS